VTDDEKRLRRLELLVQQLMIHLNVDSYAEPCPKCDSTGRWQDGGDCAICMGGGQVVSLKGGPT